MMRTKLVFPDLADMIKRELGDAVDQTGRDFIDLFAEDGAMEFPYTLPGWPKRVAGHSDLAAYLEPIADLFTVESVVGPTVHRTQEPNVVILEYSISGFAKNTHEPYDQSYVEVITLESGKIKTYRDYWNPLVVQNLTS